MSYLYYPNKYIKLKSASCTQPPMKRFNSSMFMQWVVFIPLLLPLAIVSGAFDGIKKVFEQASADIIENEPVAHIEA